MLGVKKHRKTDGETSMVFSSTLKIGSENMVVIQFHHAFFTDGLEQKHQGLFPGV